MRPDLCSQEWLGRLTRQKGREKRVKREEMVFTRLEVGCNVGMLGQQERVHLEWGVCVGVTGVVGMRLVDAALSVHSAEMLELLSSPIPACVPCISSVVSGVPSR